MSAIATFLESEGIATTGISLVREHTEQMAPPRFLWVPFPLGRPLGVPGDAEVQLEVISAALALLDEPSGPVLRDLDLALPDTLVAQASEPWSCPVSFPAIGSELSATDLGRQLEAELVVLEPWYARALVRRGRTTVGAAPGTMPEIAATLVRFTNADPDALSVRPVELKGMVEALRAYYLEAAAAQPGSNPDTLNAWFWHETHAGRLVMLVRRSGLEHAHPAIRALAAGALVPRRALKRASGQAQR